MKRISLRVLALVLALPLFSACTTNEPPPAPTPPPVVRHLTVAVGGNGTITSDTGGISCTSSGGASCMGQYSDQQVVTLTATFDSTTTNAPIWAGCSPITPATCTIKMTGDATVTVTFIPKTIGSGTGDTFVLTQDDDNANRARLISFNRTSPGTIVSDALITGLGQNSNVLGSGDSVIAMDFRPSTGQLYAVAKTPSGGGNLYVIDKGTASATKVAVLTLPSGATLTSTSNGVAYEMTFDPGIDLEYIRLFEDKGGGHGTSYRINPNDGTVTSAANQASASGVAYTNAFRGAQAFTAYAINAFANTLNIATLNGSDLSNLTSVGTLKVGTNPVPVPAANGLAIDGVKGTAYLAFNVPSTSTSVLYTVNLKTGALTSLGNLGTGIVTPTYTVAGLAIPEPLAPKIFAICEGVQSVRPTLAAAQCVAGRTLVTINPTNLGAAPNRITDVTFASEPSATVIGMDVKSSTNDIVVLSSGGNLYTINPFNGAATPLATSGAAIAPAVTNLGLAFKSDDTLRIIGGDADGTQPTGQHKNVTVASNGAVTALSPQNQAPFKIGEVAFNNNQSGSTKATYYGIDIVGNRLFTIDPGTTSTPPNHPGRITFQASFGNAFTAAPPMGFEIIGADNFGYLSYSVGGVSYLRTVNLNDGSGALQDPNKPICSASAYNGTVVGLTAPVGGGSFVSAESGANPTLVVFDATSPQSCNMFPVTTGLADAPHEEVLALNYGLQGTGVASVNTLYMLTRNTQTFAGRLYKVTFGLTTATATNVGSDGNLKASPQTNYQALDANGVYGMAINPTDGTIRITGANTNENLSVNATTALVTVLTTLAQTPTPTIKAAAYGSADTLLLYDDTNNQFMTIDSNQLVTGLGNSTVSNNDANVGFDVIGGQDGLALITQGTCAANDPTCTAPHWTKLYQVNLATGQATEACTTVATPCVGNVGTDNTQSGGTDSRMLIGPMAIRFP